MKQIQSAIKIQTRFKQLCDVSQLHGLTVFVKGDFVDPIIEVLDSSVDSRDFSFQTEKRSEFKNSDKKKSSE